MTASISCSDNEKLKKNYNQSYIIQKTQYIVLNKGNNTKKKYVNVQKKKTYVRVYCT